MTTKYTIFLPVQQVQLSILPVQRTALWMSLCTHTPARTQTRTHSDTHTPARIQTCTLQHAFRHAHPSTHSDTHTPARTQTRTPQHALRHAHPSTHSDTHTPTRTPQHALRHALRHAHHTTSGALLAQQLNSRLSIEEPGLESTLLPFQSLAISHCKNVHLYLFTITHVCTHNRMSRYMHARTVFYIKWSVKKITGYHNFLMTDWCVINVVYTCSVPFIWVCREAGSRGQHHWSSDRHLHCLLCYYWRPWTCNHLQNDRFRGNVHKQIIS